MAQKRMFDRDLVSSDSFTEMPSDAQALYFHLGVQADDEGFVTPNGIMRMISASQDSLKVLVTKKFIIPFKSGVVVIRNWKQNNWLDSRRIQPTKFTEERKMLDLTEDNTYVLSNGLAPAKHPLREYSIEEYSIEENKHMSDFEEFWVNYPEKVAKQKAKQSWSKMTQQERLLAVEAIKVHVKVNHFRGKDGKDYIPHPATWLNQKRWEDEIKKEKKSQIIVL